MTEQTEESKTSYQALNQSSSVIDWSEFPDVKRRILAAVDGSEHSQRALDWYLKQMYRDGDVIIFVHVLSPNFMVRLQSSAPVAIDVDLRESMDVSTQAAKHLREEYQKWADINQIRCAFLFYLAPKPGAAIELAAQSTEANAILIGHRGHGAFRRTLLGSVTDYVIHNVRIALMVVPPSDCH